jgi:hypothetical protein
MPILNITIQEDDSFTGLVKVEKLDDEDTPIERSIAKGLSLSSVLEEASCGQLKLGKLEINLDFDEHGEIVQIEIYS